MQRNSIGSPRCCFPARCSVLPPLSCHAVPIPAVHAGPAPVSPCLRDEPLVSSPLWQGYHPRTSAPVGRPALLRPPVRPETRPFAAAEIRSRAIIKHIVCLIQTQIQSAETDSTMTIHRTVHYEL